MPQAMLDKLPADAKKIYESAWEEGKSRGWDDERCAKYAIGAVKQAGFRKGEGERWTKMAEPMKLIFGELLGEGEWVEAACEGDVVDMNGHKVSISEDDMDQWIQAFEEGARGQDVPITIDHPKSGGIAAGWVRGLKKGPKKLIRGKDRTVFFMRPEWTPVGRQSVKNKEYQYLSLEILPENMLRAISLVNFPAVKGLNTVTQSVQLGENVFCLEEFYMAKTAEKEKKVIKLAKCPECGAPIPEDSDACPSCGAKIEEETEAMSEELQELSTKVTALTEKNVTLEATLGELKNAYAEAEKSRKSLEEANKRLEEQTSNLIDLNNMMRLHEKVADFMSLSEHPTKAIAPAFEENIIGLLLMAETPDKEQEILNFLRQLATGEAIVPMGEVGTSSVPNLPDRSPDGSRTKLHEKAKKLSEDQKISYRDALIEVSRMEEK